MKIIGLCLLTLCYLSTGAQASSLETFGLNGYLTISGAQATGTYNFQLSVEDSNSCVVYYETQSYSFSPTAGYFSLQVGAGNGTFPGGVADFTHAFDVSNTAIPGKIAPAMTTACAVNGSTAAWSVGITVGGTNLGNVPITAVPVAMSAANTSGINGYPVQPGLPGTNFVLQFDGAKWVPASLPTAGTVTNVSSQNSDITVTSPSTIPILKLNSGVGANQIVKLNASAQLPAVDASLLTNLNASALVTGTVPVANGGTGLNTSTAGNGTLLVGNGAGFSLSTLTAGTGITIANAAGGITISSSGTGTATGTAGGDLSGTYPSPTVGKIGGVAVSGSAVAGGVFMYDTTTSKWMGKAFPACTPAQTAYYNSVGDSIQCQTIAAAWGSITGAPTTLAGYGITNAVAKAGDTMSGNLNHNANFGDAYTAASGSNTVTVEGPSGSINTSYTLRLPAAQGGAGQIMTNDGSGNLSWVAAGGSPSGTAGGDLSGSYPNPTVNAVSTSTTGSIVRRDGSGNFSTNAITLNSITSASATVNLGTFNGTTMSLNDPGAATADYMSVTSSTSGNAVQIGTTGTDTNINLAILPKGTGSVTIGTPSPGSSLTVNGPVQSTSGGFKFPDGTTQTTAAAPALNRQTFTSSGTFTAPVTGTYKITLVGAGGGGNGGGGGTCSSSGSGYAGNGGGGGATVIYLTTLSSSTACTLAVGSLGAGATNTGGTGADTSISGGCPSLAAKGGGGASSSGAGLGGSCSASATNGSSTLCFDGGDGDFYAGKGGSSSLGSGGSVIANGTGGVGKSYGGGGAGGCGSASSGGSGASGVIIIEWVH